MHRLRLQMAVGAVMVAYIIAGGFLGGSVVAQSPSNGLTLDGEGIGNFPAVEAGISAYIKIDRPVDLDKAREVLRGIQAEGEGYLIGIVELAGMPNETWPHLYVDRDGWFLAYYSKYDPAVKLMPWAGYGGGAVRTTTLHMALEQVANELLTTPRERFDFTQVEAELRYYDFRFPEATQFVFAVERTGQGSSTLRYAIPDGVVVYEASWAHNSAGINDSSPGNRWAESKLNNVRLHRGGRGSYYTSGLIESEGLYRDASHTVYIGQGAGSGWSGIAVAFVYGH